MKENDLGLGEDIDKLIRQAGDANPRVTSGGRSTIGIAYGALAKLLALNYQNSKSLAESSEKLVKGSDRLEILTKWLLALTVGLMIETAVLILFELGLF